MPDGQAHKHLEWCHGCQANVSAVFDVFDWVCPLCGSVLEPDGITVDDSGGDL